VNVTMTVCKAGCGGFQGSPEGLDQRGIVLVTENTVLECIYICNVLQHNC
jgi:hypothetical protein